jgi:hypothetical protein
LRSGDPGGEALFLLHFGPRGPGHVFVLGGLRSGDPGGEALFLLHFGLRGPGHVFVLGGLRSGDPGGEALFLLHGLKSPFNNELSFTHTRVDTAQLRSAVAMPGRTVSVRARLRKNNSMSITGARQDCGPLSGPGYVSTPGEN